MGEEAWKERIRALIDVNRLTMKSASLKAGRGATFVRDILKRDVQPKADNLNRLAKALNTTTSYILDGSPEDIPDHAADSATIRIMGRVGAGAEIDPEFEQVPPEGLADVTLPFGLAEEMIGFQVVGDSMMPAYRDGDVVVVRDQAHREPASFHGEEVVVRTRDGRRYLKTIMPGPSPYTHNLLSFNATPLVGVRVVWVGSIFATVRRAEIVRMEATQRKTATIRARSGRPNRT